MSSSKGLQSFQSTLGSYSDSLNGMSDYVNNYDNNFFADWRSNMLEKAGIESAKIKAAGEVSESVGLGVEAFKRLKARYGAKKADEDGDEDGDGKEDDEEEGEDEGGESGEPEAQGADDAADAGNTPLDSAPNEGTGSSFQAAEDTPLEDSSALPEAGGEMELADASTFGASAESAAATPLSTALNAPANVGTSTQSAILDADPEGDVAGLGGDIGGDVAEGAADTIGDTAATFASAAADAASTAGTAIAGAAGAVGDAALGAAAVGAEALGPLGILAGIGIGLYELFHHHKDPTPPKAPPPPIVSSTRGELTLPSFDSAVDTPASQGAF